MKKYQILLVLFLCLVVVGGKGGSCLQAPSSDSKAPPAATSSESKFTSVAQYPDYGPLPSPMNDDGHKTEPNRYTFKYILYNPDGTLIANPVIPAVPAPLDATTYAGYPAYTFKKLTSSDTINITDPSIAPLGFYTVYSALPTNMTVAEAYSDTAQYYPAVPATPYPDPPPYWNFWDDLFITWPDQRTIPTKINSGTPFYLSTLVAEDSKSSAEDKSGTKAKVKVVNSAYYLPFAVDGAALGAHNELTGNVAWTIDLHLDDSFSFPNGQGYHLLPFGWALNSGDCNKGVTFSNTALDGGTVPSTTVLANAKRLFNFWISLISNNICNYLDPTDGSDQSGVYSKLITDHVAALKASPGYPFPSADWLKEGAFMMLQPQPGFQRNLNRWYTPWGGWNLFNNTCDLFVRKDGGVEIPLTADGSRAIPLVTQTWTNQDFVFINNTSQPIPSSTDTYPGDELYLAGNTYFPGHAGVMTCYRQFMFYGNAGFVARSPDNWLGLKGKTLKQVMDWAYAEGPVEPELSSGALINGWKYIITASQANHFFAGCAVGNVFTATAATSLDASNKVQVYKATDPGGMADKPYMYAVNVDQHGAINFMFENGNSAPVAKQRQTDLAGPAPGSSILYAAKVYIDRGSGSGYEHLVTFNYSWQDLVLKNITGNGVPTWQTAAGADDGLGAILPKIDYINDTLLGQLPTIKIYAFMATNIDISRALTLDAANPVNIAKLADVPLNSLGGKYYQYQLGGPIGLGAKVLVVFD
ncbi:MAG: hypothetical protein NTW80_12515 [Deltaproteobacteria bacterium]|nr:hypothetical protein [Deltaproteobacteria bacterium]